MIRGQGLCKLAIKSNNQALDDISGWENELTCITHELLVNPNPGESWYVDLINFINNGACPSHLNL